MRLLGVFGELTQLRREFRQLTTESVAEEEKAKYELTASARRFSRKTKNLVDDKMSFSATLMRAGEVDAANRLLEEVEQDVRVEEAALLEKMNEVKLARANKRERITRVRLARLMAVSLAGSMLMGFSALGMAAAGFMQERENDQIHQNAVAMRRAARAKSASGAVKEKLRKQLKGLDKEARQLILAGMEEGELTAAEANNIRTLAASGDVPALERLINNVLPTDLARALVTRIAHSVDNVAAAAPEVGAPVESVVPKVRKKARKAAEPEPEPEPESSPSPEPSPSPEEAEEKGDKQETEDRDGDGKETSGGSGDGTPLDDTDLGDGI